MTSVQQIDLDELIREIDHQRVPKMPPAPLRVRIPTSMSLRRVLPTRIVVKRAAARAERAWEASATAREDAAAVMELVLAETEQAETLGGHARRYLIESRVCSALFWQPWTRSNIDLQSQAHARAALADGRGVLVSACHLGPYFRTLPTLPGLGFEPYVVAGPWFLEAPTPDYWGRRLARWRAGIRDSRIVRSKDSFPVLQALLERGEHVLSYFDLPGPRETLFLGKRATLADGAVRLALATDALVLPVRERRVGHTVWMDVAPALDPAGFADEEQQLHRALAQVHERWILEQPWALESPNEIGWKATPSAWLHPRAQASADAGVHPVGRTETAAPAAARNRAARRRRR